MFKKVREHFARRSNRSADAGHAGEAADEGVGAAQAEVPGAIPNSDQRSSRGVSTGGVPNLFPFDSDGFLADPYPYYAKLRAAAPLYRSPDGFWVLSRYNDVAEALAHSALGNRPSRFSTLHSSKASRYECASFAANILPFLDGAEHRANRSTLASLFQRRVREWAPELDSHVTQAIDGLDHEFDALPDLATPLATRATRSFLGLPDDERLARWSDHFFYLFTKIPSAELRTEIDASLGEYREWGSHLVQDSHSTGLVAQLRAAIRSGALTECVAIDTLLLLYADGVQNVDTGIANALHAFAGAPQAWSQLCADDAKLSSAVEECLRFDSPAQFVARTVVEDFDWHGQTLKQDHNVFLLLASANRDAKQFSDADEFRLDRPRGRHLSFGKGRHACLGGNLFEMELRAVLAGLSARFSGLKLCSPVIWQKRTGHRWIESARFRVTS